MSSAFLVGVVLFVSAFGSTSRSLPRRAVLAVCDFESTGDGGRLGRRIAEALRMKLARFEDEFVLVEYLDLKDALAAAGAVVRFDTDRTRLTTIGRRVLAADILVWGRVERRDGRFTIRARALDLREHPSRLYVDNSFPAGGYREIPFAVWRIVNAVRRDEAAPDPAFDPRQPGPTKPDPKVLARPNLLVNGDFEWGEKTPVGWEPVDGLVSFWVRAPGREGKCIMFDTDVNDEQWRRWHREFVLGTSESPPKPIRGRGPKYDTVAASHGAWLYNDRYLPVKQGQTYRISFDFKGRMAGDMFFAKVFVKGYTDTPVGKREVWRCYKACRVETNGRRWEHFTRTFNPTRRTPQVKWIRVELFAYWPPGRYYFDNIHLCEEPSTSATSPSGEGGGR